MDSATQVQILNYTVCISHNTITQEKGMDILHVEEFHILFS